MSKKSTKTKGAATFYHKSPSILMMPLVRTTSRIPYLRSARVQQVCSDADDACFQRGSKRNH